MQLAEQLHILKMANLLKGSRPGMTKEEKDNMSTISMCKTTPKVLRNLLGEYHQEKVLFGGSRRRLEHSDSPGRTVRRTTSSSSRQHKDRESRA